MLTLDETTLFYFSLTNTNTSGKKIGSLITNWANEVTSRLPSHSNLQANSKASNAHSVTSHGPAASRSASTKSSTTSVLTKRVAITSSVELDGCDVGDGDDGAGIFLDEDETQGAERDAAVASPPKGKRRLSSSVSQLLNSSLEIQTLGLLNPIYYRLLSSSITRPKSLKRFHSGHESRRSSEMKTSLTAVRNVVDGEKTS